MVVRNAYNYCNGMATGKDFVLIFFLAISFLSITERNAIPGESSIFEAIAEHEMNEMQRGINQWTDEALTKKYQNFPFTDKVVGELYQEFNDVIVDPPHPDQEPYQLTIESDRVLRITGFGKQMHNMASAMPDDAFARWGHLLMGMREILYLDSIHATLAMMGNPPEMFIGIRFTIIGWHSYVCRLVSNDRALAFELKKLQEK